MLSLCWNSKCNKYNIIIEQECLSKILEMAQGNNPNEIGSSIVGSYEANGFTAVIKDVVPIPKDSIFSRFFFRRGQKGLKDYYKNLYKESNGYIHYIGEWHSHPYGSPTPSSTDDKTQKKITQNLKVNCSECILLLIGNDLIKKPQVGLYVYSRTNGKIKLYPKTPNNPFI